MEDKRALEIAMIVLNLLYRKNQYDTRRIMNNLQDAGATAKIPDEEMKEFGVLLFTTMKTDKGSGNGGGMGGH